MIEKVSNRITDYFIENKYVDQEDRDIYLYGSEILVSEIICTVITLGIGIFLGIFVKTVLYLTIYTMIRVYAGGYHAMSHKMCITLFNVLYICFSAVTELAFCLNISDFLCLVTIFAILIILRLAPVQDMRKVLDKSEIESYRKIARRRTVFWGVSVILAYCYIPYVKVETGYGMTAICEVALLVLIGYIKNICLFRRENKDK